MNLLILMMESFPVASYASYEWPEESHFTQSPRFRLIARQRFYPALRATLSNMSSPVFWLFNGNIRILKWRYVSAICLQYELWEGLVQHQHIHIHNTYHKYTYE